MPRNSEQVLTDAMRSLGGGGSDPVTAQLMSLADELQQLQGINQQEETLLSGAAQSGGAAASNGGGSVLGSIGSAVEGFLGFGLGVTPLISGLASLFGGGSGESTPAPLVPFVAPLPVNATAGISASSSSAFAVDNADGGLPRPAPQQSSPQITVQVQAMDSQSFLDRSNDIAMAVRQAMLQSSVLNDVIREV